MADTQTQLRRGQCGGRAMVAEIGNEIRVMKRAAVMVDEDFGDVKSLKDVAVVRFYRPADTRQFSLRNILPTYLSQFDCNQYYGCF